MNKNGFNGKVSAEITAADLHRLYDLLEQEERPYEAFVSGKGTRKITIFCNPEDVEHFNKLIANGYKAEI